MSPRFFSEDEYEDLLIKHEEFAAIAARWFVVEAVDRQLIDALFRQWEAFVANEARVAGHDSLFEPENAGRLAGLAWYEELVWRAEHEVIDISPEARVCMFLSTEVQSALTIRLYCPQHLVGTWQCFTNGNKRVLGANGELEAKNAPEGARWCVHLEGRKPRQSRVSLFIIPADGRTPLVRIALKIDHDEIETAVSDLKNQVERWKRAG